MIFNVHAGHAAIGKGAIGSVGILNESVEDRRVKNEVIRLLRLLGHTVYDCTCDSGTQSSVLAGIVKMCNAHKVDLDVSIHFNSSVNDRKGDGKTTGTECYIYNSKSVYAKEYATKVVNAISELGFRNRGVKIDSALYVLKHTKAQAILIECCFVDDKDDAELYDAEKMAEAIVYGLTGQKYVANIVINDKVADDVVETATGNTDSIYRVQVGAFTNKANADRMVKDLESKGFKGYVIKA